MHCFRPPRGPRAQERGADGPGGFQRDWPGGPLVGDRKAVLGEGGTHLSWRGTAFLAPLSHVTPLLPHLWLPLTGSTPDAEALSSAVKAPSSLSTNGSLHPSQAPLLTPNIPGPTEVFLGNHHCAHCLSPNGQPSVFSANCDRI